MIRPLVFDGTRLYLERYWRFEDRVAGELLRRALADGGLTLPSPDLDALLDELFPGDDNGTPDLQREAAERALSRRIAVIAGGPGTGKTRTIARLLGAAHGEALARGGQLDVALAAPTGKAAERMTAAVHEEAEEASLREGVARRAACHRGKDLAPAPGRACRREASIRPSQPASPRPGRHRRDVDGLPPADGPSARCGAPRLHPRVGRRPLSAGQCRSRRGSRRDRRSVRRPGRETARWPTGVVLLDRARRFGASSQIAALADAIRLGDDNRAVDLLGEGAQTS